MLIPKPTTSTSNGKYQLLTCMLQAPCMLGGLMLIPIFVTFFMSSIQSSPMALRAQFMYYIIFYSFKHGRSPCDIFGEIEEVWFGGYELIPFEPFAWAQHMHASKWAKDTGNTLGSWKKSYTYNFHPKIVFMLWLIVAQSFCPNPFFLKNCWLSLANFSC